MLLSSSEKHLLRDLFKNYATREKEELGRGKSRKIQACGGPRGGRVNRDTGKKYPEMSKKGRVTGDILYARARSKLRDKLKIRIAY